eukprot:scaffold307773_cov41-Prasinocladus_malaysianus.AAC.2
MGTNRQSVTMHWLETSSSKGPSPFPGDFTLHMWPVHKDFTGRLVVPGSEHICTSLPLLKPGCIGCSSLQQLCLPLSVWARP